MVSVGSHGECGCEGRGWMGYAVASIAVNSALGKGPMLIYRPNGVCGFVTELLFSCDLGQRCFHWGEWRTENQYRGTL